MARCKCGVELAGRRSVCDECKRLTKSARNRRWNEKNKDKRRELNKKYREDNVFELREYHRSYYRKNRDRIQNYKREYYKQNKQRVLGWVKDRDARRPFYNSERSSHLNNAFYQHNPADEFDLIDALDLMHETWPQRVRRVLEERWGDAISRR